MNKTQVAELLTRASMLDNRKITEDHVDEWHKLLANVNYDMASQAMQWHYEHSGEWLTPYQLLTQVRRLRNEAAEKKQKELLRESEGAVASPKPINFDDMVAFYAELSRRRPWNANENPDAIARSLGMVPPAPIFEDQLL